MKRTLKVTIISLGAFAGLLGATLLIMTLLAYLSIQLGDVLGTVIVAAVVSLPPIFYVTHDHMKEKEERDRREKEIAAKVEQTQSKIQEIKKGV